ncbi:tRNA (adenosine(37)-N6)-threonylcarbamoyltransferase complex dimerization subunit type 1 TsaB [Asaia sp. BMEF1]|uniref:tRNA threonylcarbamoyladenosine biosynthesis protein TsaB n=1 Tax=Asaia sp. BMEF1 TaxID=3155932 RepID=UPI003F6708D1
MAADGPTRSLVLNGATLGAGSRGDVAAFLGSECVAHERLEGVGATASLASTCQVLFRALGWQQGPHRIIAVTGPGSFTGLRASLALADGLAFGCGATLHGVTTGQCFRAHSAWGESICVTQARRNRIFAELLDGTFWAGAPAELELPAGSRVIGNGVSLLQDTGLVRIDETQPDIGLIFDAGSRMAASGPLQPLYIDAPEAKPPAQGLRPAPLP